MNGKIVFSNCCKSPRWIFIKFGMYHLGTTLHGYACFHLWEKILNRGVEERIMKICEKSPIFDICEKHLKIIFVGKLDLLAFIYIIFICLCQYKAKLSKIKFNCKRFNKAKMSHFENNGKQCNVGAPWWKNWMVNFFHFLSEDQGRPK